MEHPAHHPSAPADELFDITTTVDPSYVISLIRKLLPPTMNAANSSDKVGGRDSGTQGSNDVEKEGSLPLPSGDEGPENEYEAMEVNYDFDNRNRQERRDDNSSHQGHVTPSVGEDSWEEYGCILWDLATSRTHAELLVQNLVLEVILTTLMVSQSPRITEISLGIIGNLACHEVSQKHITSVQGLVAIIVDQLFVDDTPCLCEEFRLLTLCLQGSESITWAEALHPDQVLSRILWVVENTLSPQLLEKSIGLLLATLESQQEVSAILLPQLMKLGLPAFLINLLAFEVCKIEGEDRHPERYPVLDVVLRAIEALSIIDSYSQELSSSKKLFQQLTTLIKLPDKYEVANSCVTAVVLVANILSDADDLVLEIRQDMFFLQSLFDIFPFASDDMEARNALWDIIARLLAQVQQCEMSPLNLHHYMSVLASKSDLLEEELLDQQLAVSNKDHESSNASGTNIYIRTAALKWIDHIVSQWLALKDVVTDGDYALEYPINERDIDRLKDCCHKYSKAFLAAACASDGDSTCKLADETPQTLFGD